MPKGFEIGTDSTQVGLRYDLDRLMADLPEDQRAHFAKFAEQEFVRLAMLLLSWVEAATLSPDHMGIVLAVVYRDGLRMSEGLLRYLERLTNGSSTFEELMAEIGGMEPKTPPKDDVFGDFIEGLSIDDQPDEPGPGM